MHFEILVLLKYNCPAHQFEVIQLTFSGNVFVWNQFYLALSKTRCLLISSYNAVYSYPDYVLYTY